MLAVSMLVPDCAVVLGTAFEVVRDVFAVVGALGSLGGLGWRVFSWRHEQQTHLKVTANNLLPTYTDGTVGDWSYAIEATNSGPHPIRVTSAGFRLPDGRDVIVPPTYDGALPTEIPARDSRQTWLAPELLEQKGVDIYAPMVAFVRTAAGERFESKPNTMRDPE